MRKFLIFEINGEHFGIDVKFLEGIFLIEEYFYEENMPSYVKGIYKFDNIFYPVICLQELLKLGKCKKDIQNETIVLVNMDNYRFSLLVDSVYKIFPSNHNSHYGTLFKVENIICKEIDKNYILDKVDKIFFYDYKFETKKIDKYKKKDEKKYLIFQLETSLYAIEDSLIKNISMFDRKKVNDTICNEEWIIGNIQNGHYDSRVGDLKNLFHIERKFEEKLILFLEKEKKQFGFLIDDVLKIVKIQNREIRNIDEKIIKGVFEYDDRIVSLLDTDFIEKIIREHGIKNSYDIIQKDEEETKKYVFFQVEDRWFALEIEKCDFIISKEKIELMTKYSSSDFVKGMFEYRNDIYFLVTLFKGGDFNEVILIKKLDIGLGIQQAFSMKSVKKENIHAMRDENNFIKEIIVEDDKNIDVVNIEWFLQHIDTLR